MREKLTVFLKLLALGLTASTITVLTVARFGLPSFFQEIAEAHATAITYSDVLPTGYKKVIAKYLAARGISNGNIPLIFEF